MLTFALLGIFVRYAAKQRETWLLCYRGLPFHKQRGMRFLIKGCKILASSGYKVRMKRFDSRLWISPEVVAFEDPETGNLTD